MQRIFSLITALALAFSLAGTVQAKSCKDPATGKFVKCAAAATTVSKPAPGGYTLDARGNCHDAKGKMAKKAMCSGAVSTTASTSAPAAPAPATRTTSTTTASSTMTTSTGGHPQCKKGKPCGNSCIAMDKVCHKQ